MERSGRSEVGVGGGGVLVDEAIMEPFWEDLRMFCLPRSSGSLVQSRAQWPVFPQRAHFGFKNKMFRVHLFCRPW